MLQLHEMTGAVPVPLNVEMLAPTFTVDEAPTLPFTSWSNLSMYWFL